MSRRIVGRQNEDGAGRHVGVVLAVDAGTTGVTALLVTEEADVLARGYSEFAQHFPRPGWVEHAPEEIWQATLTATQAAQDAAPDAVIRAVGITNQRETAVLRDRDTLAAPRRAIVWQDRRTSAICERLESAGHGAPFTELTGLRLDPYFTGTKLTWLRENDSRAWAGVASGQVAVGTVDSYLVARMSSGGAFVTDASNASRTLLYDVQQGTWSAELCELLGVPLGALPRSCRTGARSPARTLRRFLASTPRSREWPATSRLPCSGMPALALGMPNAPMAPARSSSSTRERHCSAAMPGFCRRSPGKPPTAA